MPLSVALQAIHHRNASILKCTLRAGGRRHRQGEIPEHDDVPTDIQSMLRVGETLVPMIFMSDKTHLSNFAGDKKEWPVYMTIGNLSSKLRQMPSTHTVLMVSLVPITIKNRNILPKWLDEQRHTIQVVVNKVLWRILQPHTFKPNPSAESGHYNILSADGNFRCCKPVIAAWLTDCPEYSNLNHLERHVWFGVRVQRTNLEIMSLLTSNTPGRITTYIERAAMPTPRQPMQNSCRPMFTEDSTGFGIFPVS
jgi:hypothetical protein